jgi:hypothetical protein
MEKAERSDDPSRGATLSKYSHDRTVLVGIYCNNQDPQTVTESLRAYADLVRKCLDGEQTAGGQGLWVRWLSSDFSPPTNVKMSVFREVRSIVRHSQAHEQRSRLMAKNVKLISLVSGESGAGFGTLEVGKEITHGPDGNELTVTEKRDLARTATFFEISEEEADEPKSADKEDDKDADKDKAKKPKSD